MASKEIDVVKMINDHRPKNFKYKYILKDPDLISELESKGFDMLSLDTIDNTELTQLAIDCVPSQEFGRESVAKAKSPTILDDGVVLSKQLITKTDKKLQTISLGHFDYKGMHHICIRFIYEKFDIIEIFIMV